MAMRVISVTINEDMKIRVYIYLGILILGILICSVQKRRTLESSKHQITVT